MKYSLSVVLPLHNEMESLPLLLDELSRVLSDYHGNWEIVAIDDGSRDATWFVIAEIIKNFSRLRGIRFSRNFGKEAAILAGLKAAKGDWIIVMDADGQHPPSLLPVMLEHACHSQAQIVAARKREQPSEVYLARVFSSLFNRIMYRATGLNLRGASDYRLLKRPVVDAILSMPERIRFFRAMTVWTGFQQYDVEFDVPPRLGGNSSWSLIGLLRYAVTGIVGFSSKPLLVSIYIGFIGIFVSMALAAQAIFSWASGEAVSGWTSLTLVILFFGSCNLITVGILGVYMSQLFDEIKSRPSYLIAEEIEAKIKLD